MKLVELLAVEMNQWPQRAVAVDQSVVDNEVYAYDGSGALAQTGLFLSQQADDPDTHVTLEDWRNECLVVAGAGSDLLKRATFVRERAVSEMLRVPKTPLCEATAYALYDAGYRKP